MTYLLFSPFNVMTIISSFFLAEGKRISTILRKEGLKNFFEGGGLMVKGWSIFAAGDSGFLEIGIINFTSLLLFDLVLRCRPKDVSLTIFHLCL